VRQRIEQHERFVVSNVFLRLRGFDHRQRETWRICH
jgi:hypothetical protein